MISSENLLIEAPQGRHFAQLHQDIGPLVDAVTVFVQAGLRRGEGVIVIASPGHFRLLSEALTTSGVDLDAYQRSGQFAVASAEAMLARFMRRGMPDWAEFRRSAGNVMETVAATGCRAIRAYSEMVDILWRSGNPPAGIRLEEYWNDLGRAYSFSHFCSFLLDGLDEAVYQSPLHEIGRTHSDVVATAEDARFAAAVEAASRDVLGTSVSYMLSLSSREEQPGEQRLPDARRTVLWLKRNMPTAAASVLSRARQYYR